MPFVHLDQSFTSFVKRPTAPRPLPRMAHQSPLHRIRMHVIEFLSQLLFPIDVEIEVSPLPEPPVIRQILRETQSKLPGRTPFPPRAVSAKPAASTLGLLLPAELLATRRSASARARASTHIPSVEIRNVRALLPESSQTCFSPVCFAGRAAAHSS